MLAQSNKRPFVKNAILAGISLPDLAALRPFLEPFVLRQRTILQEPRKPVEYVYFIESGIVSLRIVAAESMLETAIVGYHGAVGASLVFEGHVQSYRAVVLFPGAALRIRLHDLRRVLNECDQIREHLLRYVQALAIHGAQSGFCGVRHNLEQRLASWLCLTCDALDGRVLPVTHDHLSNMLGLRRPGVTETLIRFEEQGLIRKMRGILQVDDRMRLEQKACSCYGIVAGTYISAGHQPRMEQRAEVSA